MSVAIIEIGEEAETRGGTKRDTGEVWSTTTQTGYIHGKGLYPQPFTMFIPKDKQGYPKGFYMLDASVFSLGKDGYLSIRMGGDGALIPLAECIRDLQAKLSLKSVAA